MTTTMQTLICHPEERAASDVRISQIRLLLWDCQPATRLTMTLLNLYKYFFSKCHQKTNDL
ncbi:MAG: hypothetical protein ACI9Y8_001427 [Candidatus Omnitrophota bacterium]|jgi:hypothetical protein